MRKILITGAGTLIGGEIVKFLAKKGFRIIGIYNKSVPASAATWCSYGTIHSSIPALSNYN